MEQDVRKMTAGKGDRISREAAVTAAHTELLYAASAYADGDIARHCYETAARIAAKALRKVPSIGYLAQTPSEEVSVKNGWTMNAMLACQVTALAGMQIMGADPLCPIHLIICQKEKRFMRAGGDEVANAEYDVIGAVLLSMMCLGCDKLRGDCGEEGGDNG